MRTTARFEIERQNQLAKVFTRSRLIDVWKKLVRQQLRQQAIADLYDYYDFHATIVAHSDSIVERILTGQYRAEVPVIFKMEKKLGICRHMMVPSPADALVFQVLTDSLYLELMKVQPSKKAYYARDRHFMKLPHEVAEEQSYPWFKLWPKFQEAIWGFSGRFPLLVTTDITNYYDSIGFEELRRVISATAPTTEVLLDLLFTLVQDLAWTPDYLPRTPRGLPVINLEAPRLLAHSFLFEIDRVVQHRTKDNFVRWMDDINFGANDFKQAQQILGEVNDVLKSRGLALNLGKTEILTSRQARRHFLIEENRKLTARQRRAGILRSDRAKANLATKVYREFREHLAQCQERNKDKVTKRYMTVLGTLRSQLAAIDAAKLFLIEPSLREAASRYIASLPFSRVTCRCLIHLLQRVPRYDDIARLEVVKAVVNHAVPVSATGKSFVRRIAGELAKPVSGFDWYGRLLFLAKYGEPHEVLTAAEQARKVARGDLFLARQTMAVIARAARINPSRVERLWSQEVSRGAADSASVAVSLLDFMRAGFPAKSMAPYHYLFPKKSGHAYPISKFLILCAIGAGEEKRGKSSSRPEVATSVKDGWMLLALRQVHPAWFK